MRLTNIVLMVLVLKSYTWYGCQTKTVPSSMEQPIASVGGKHLYASDMINILHPTTSTQDSASITTAYIDQWVRDQLMARQASKFFSSDQSIEQLVDDYRSKLLKHYLEEQIISARFDTTITPADKSLYYDKIKDQFPLQEAIYKIEFAQISRDAVGLKEVAKDWRADRDSLVFAFMEAYGISYISDTTQWYSRAKLDDLYPNWSSRRLVKGGKQRQQDNEYEYYLKVADHRDKGDLAPLSYLDQQIMRMILHDRKKLILEEYKQELYESALNDNLIKL